MAAVAVVGAALAMGGCGDEPPTREAATSTTPAAHRCFDDPGGITDLSDGGWRSASGRRWTTTDGCWVRSDVVTDFDGPAHCEWQAMRAIVVSEPIGRRFRGPRTAARFYVRDPENVLGDAVTAERLDVDAVLPGTAADTGLRLGATELWAVPGDPEWIYLRGDDAVERWPLDRDVPGCA